MRRRLQTSIEQDLNEKMVFLSGPRQCGKTTLAQEVGRNQKSHYYSWDFDEDRMLIKKNQIDPNAELWIFDELHKNRSWRNWIKGLYDKNKGEKKILVTGSARLDIYRFGGDSLQGRFFSHRLHPLTLSEVMQVPTVDYDKFYNHIKSAAKTNQDCLRSLMFLGGFPEPFISSSEKKAKRWRMGYLSRLVRDDIRDLENVADLAKLELMLHRLPEMVGSVFSLNSLREDLEVSFPTSKRWLEIFEKTFAIFRVLPFGPEKIKAVKKEPKIYFWDWGSVEDESARFENLVAVHLLRFVHWMEDVEGEKYELRYFRSTVGHEVDFIILKNKKPLAAIEVKLNDRPLDTGLKYFLERVQVAHAFQISYLGAKDYRLDSINGCKVRICQASSFLVTLP